MNNLTQYERDTLKYLLKTKDDPKDVRQSARARALISYAVGAIAILAASHFLESLGWQRWIWLASATFGGVLITYGAIHAPIRSQYEALHDFVDFDKVRAALDETARR